jgi:hypothetical protein
LKQSKKLSKPFAVVIALLLITTVFLPVKVYPLGSEADIEMEVQAGFDGAARLGAYIPYRVLLINKGRAGEGEAQIEIKIDSQSKTVFSKPVSLAEGAVKEIIINAPVFSARRGVKAKFQENRKTLKEVDYTFTKLIPPEIKTIGVLSSDNAAYSFLNGAMIPQPDNAAYEEKIMAMHAAGVYSTTSSAIMDVRLDEAVRKVESTLIPLTRENFPEDIKVMNGFDTLIISNYDTGTLSQKQLSVIEKWVEEGGTLVIGTGANWKKVYNSLPEALKKFTVSGTESIKPAKELEEFCKTDFMGDVNLDTVVGSIGFEYKEETDKPDEENNTSPEDIEEHQPVYSINADEVLMGDGERPLAVKYIHKSGRILFLAFDPGMEPVAGWEGKQALWENLLFHSNNANNIYQEGPGYYYSNYKHGYYFDDLAGQVPEDRSPPFLFMFITIAAYIIIVGPAMYLLLKKKDKRDFNWLAVPAAALIFLLIIYMVGFKTRYKTAVLNTVSMIKLDTASQKVDITTGMGIFNNKRGDLKLTYSQKDNIDFNIMQSGSRNYVVYADGKEPEGRIVSRLVLAEPASYELYDVSMWEPKFLTAGKNEAFQDELLNLVQINEGKFKAVIKNSTKYDFIEAFITVGSNFISAGDILSGQEKVIEADMNSENVYKSFDAYLDAKYGRTSYPSNMALPDDFLEKRRKRLAIERLLEPQYSGIRGQTKIGLYALNYQNLGYDIKINGEQPVTYFTNGIFSSMDMNFEKGQKFDIPSGIILPHIDEYGIVQRVATVDGDVGVRIRNEGDIDFIYHIPEGMQPTEFSLKFNTYIPLYVKYNIEEMKARNNNVQMKILQNRYEYYLYNKSSENWERINDLHTQAKDVEQYIDEERKLKVRVKVVEMAKDDSKSPDEYIELERLSFPGLQLKGVVQ